MKRSAAAFVAVSLALSPSGAWAQRVAAVVAPRAVAAAPAFAPVQAGLAVGSLSAAGLPSVGLLPSLPAAPARAVLPAAPVAAAVRALASPQAVAAAAKASDPASPRAAAARTVSRAAESAAPHLSAAADAAGGSASAHSAGVALEAVLTGAPSRILSEAVEAPRSGVLPGTRAGLLHGEDPADAAPKAEPPHPEVPASARRAFGVYTAGVSTVKIGIETLNLVVPILLLTQYGTASVLGALFVTAQIAGMAAGGLLGPVIDRLGPARSLAAAAFAQAAVIAVVPASVLLGAPVSLPVLFGLFALNGALSGVFDIARRSAPPAILGTDEGVLRKYNAKLYIVRELAAMGAVFGAGWLVAHEGALAAVGIHPAAYLAAAVLFWFLSKARLSKAAPPSQPPAEDGGGARWSDIVAGARVVLKDPALRLAALVNIPVIALHNTFHAMLAAVFAASVLGNPAGAAVLIGAWNAGELAAAFYMDRRGQDGSSVSWIRYAALTGLAAWALWAAPSLWVGAAAAFLMATGTLGNEIGLNSFFQSAAPKERVGAVTGFVYSAATAAAMLFMLAMGWAFDALGARAGFFVLAAALTAVSAFYLVASRALGRRAAESASRPSSS